MNQPWVEEESAKVVTCPSSGALEVANGFLTFRYDWEFQGEPQEGLMLIPLPPKECGWTDSFHSAGALMVLPAEERADGALSFLGSYTMPGYSTFGWRIVLDQPSPDRVMVVMENIPPDSESEWAVRAEYTVG